MIINNIAKDLETKRSKVLERLERYNNRHHKTNILPLLWRAQKFRFCGVSRKLRAKLYKAVDNLYNRDTLYRNKQPKQAYTKELVGYDTMAPVNVLAACPIDSDNCPYSAVGLCNNSQWTYYALFHPCFISSACFDYPNNKVFNFSQLPINSTTKF